MVAVQLNIWAAAVKVLMEKVEAAVAAVAVMAQVAAVATE
jgi:hypothetical protein